MTESLLKTVARHEGALMAQLAEAKAEARREIEEAHAAGAIHLQQMQNKLEAAMAERRREAAESRENTRKAIEAQTLERVSKIRVASAGRRQTAMDQMLALLLPGTK